MASSQQQCHQAGSSLVNIQSTYLVPLSYDHPAKLATVPTMDNYTLDPFLMS